MKRIFLPGFVVVLGLILLAGGCGGTENEPSDDMVLRNYQVPEGYESDVRSTLRAILMTSSDNPIGRVSTLPGGKIAVLAPATVHKGLEDLLADFGSAESLSASRKSISMNYWFVVGRLATRSGASGEAAGKLAAVRPALDKIEQVDGQMEFGLIERINLISMQGHRAAATGRFAHIQHRASLVDRDVIAEVVLQYFKQRYRLESHITLKPDQILVLAQTGYPPAERNVVAPAFPDAQDNEDVTLYIIVTSGS